MKIIIEIKESAKLERIALMGDYLECDIKNEFDDVIQDISKEF